MESLVNLAQAVDSCATVGTAPTNQAQPLLGWTAYLSSPHLKLNANSLYLSFSTRI